MTIPKKKLGKVKMQKAEKPFKAEKRIIRGFNLRVSTIEGAKKKAKEFGYSLNGFVEQAIINACDNKASK